MSETGTAVAKKQGKPRGMQGLARRIAQDAKLLEQAAQREDARRAAEHERVRALASMATGGGFFRLLRDSPVLSEEDKDFLASLKYFVASS